MNLLSFFALKIKLRRYNTGELRRAVHRRPPPQPFDASDVAEVMRLVVAALPEAGDLPAGLCDDVSVVSNSSSLLGRNLVRRCTSTPG